MGNRNPFIKDVLDFNKWMYSLTGFGSADFKSKTHKRLYLMYRTFVQLTFVVLLTSMYREVVVSMNNLAVLSFTLSFVLLASVGVCKIINVHMRWNDIEGMRKRLSDNLNLPWLGREDWEQELRNKNSNIIKMLITSMYLGVLAEVILTAALPLVKNGKRKFFLPLSFNYLVKTRYFVPIYWVHLFDTFVFLLNFLAHDLTFITFLARLGENLEIVTESLNRFTASYEFESMNRDNKRKGALVNDATVKVPRECTTKKNKLFIKKCIIHHQAVIRELKIIGSVYGGPVFLHFMFGPFLCAFLSYAILTEKDENDLIVQQVIFALIAALYLLLFCYAGTYLLDKFQEVRFAFYSYPWYDMDMDTKKSILLVLLGLGKSGKLTAGKIFDVTLKEYLTISKATYNIVTVLNNTT